MNTSRRRLLGAAALLVAARTLAGSSSAAAQPPPPPNPSDEDLEAGRQGVAGVDAELARLGGELAAANAALDAAQAELGTALAVADQAIADRDLARAAAEAAGVAAEEAAAGQVVADQLTADAQAQLDLFVAASYRQGSSVGSTAGYFGSENPEDVLDRAELLAAMGSEQRGALESLERAQVAQANQESLARAALAEAERTRVAAEEATVAAQAAYDDAVVANDAASARTAELLTTQADTQARLTIAQQTLTGLNGQRRTYEEWVAERQRQEAAAAAAAAEAQRQREAAAAEAAAAARQQARQAPPSGGGGGGGGGSEGAPPPASAPPAVVGPPSSSGTVAPANGRLSSRFGPRSGGIHYGIDIANSIGTPIVSVRSGTVISAGPASGFGLWVRVRHDDGTVTVYGHNDYNIVSVGQRVGVGQQIAVIGNRGQSTGPHVHFEVAPGGGAKVDPLTWLRSRGVPI